MTRTVEDYLDLLDWRRRVFSLYEEVRGSMDPRRAWDRWRDVRGGLISSHPQSPIREDERRAEFGGPAYYDYDPQLRVLAEVDPAEPERVVVEGSADGRFEMTRFGLARFDLAGEPRTFGLYWLEGYAAGIFLSFRDATSGSETYGAGRYLLDTAKGADLGTEGSSLILDFNFAYQPSCSYDPQWACPLAPPENRLPIPIRAGERLA